MGGGHLIIHQNVQPKVSHSFAFLENMVQMLHFSKTKLAIGIVC